LSTIGWVEPMWGTPLTGSMREEASEVVLVTLSRKPRGCPEIRGRPVRGGPENLSIPTGRKAGHTEGPNTG
jgi:hypothetical protein